MSVSQKCQYALRALFELAKRQGQGPISVAQLAAAQAIPPRFLELIVQQLRQAGYVESRRGIQGGYQLAVSPERLTVADIIRLIDGGLAPVSCAIDQNTSECSLLGHCAFLGLWRRAGEALRQVYETTTLQNLIDEERQTLANQTPDYSI
jgi:Rrf2 family protein